ncbi:MAG: hypothetical protein KC519_13855 [Anaerolineae bacterium]|nr:hypothetical protein [Anaerolineae bacterium]
MSAETIFLAAEFIYRPRPTSRREREVFDHNLRARLGSLSTRDSALFICDSDATCASLLPITNEFQLADIHSAIVNPEPHSQQQNTPSRCAWDAPETWQQMTMSDRWARILYALEAAQQRLPGGYLVMPAQDAVYNRLLLERLVEVSRADPGGVCAVSPHTRLVHTPPADADAQQRAIADLHNAAFDRSALENICAEGGQGYWGKMGIIPFEVCGALRSHVETHTWEDDLEIDSVLTELGHPARCIAIDDAALYRLTPPIFDRAAVRTTIARHLHYSLKIPGEKRSALQTSPSAGSLLRAQQDPAYARALTEANQMIESCEADMRARVADCGVSWVDWGAYRYVARPRDPAVEVWKQRRNV